MTRDVLFETPPKKKVLTLAGIELKSPHLPVCSADHSAIRPKNFKKIKKMMNNAHELESLG